MPAPNNTIYALTEEARRLPDNSLITNLQNHSGSIPSWVLLGEVERRKALRDGATASKEPEGTVAKDAIAGLQSIAQQSPPAPQPQPQAPQGAMQPQMPTASMAAGGGIRSLAEGGGIEDELQAGDEAAAFYASQAEQEDGDGPDDEGDGDIDGPDYGAEDDDEYNAQPEDDSEEPTFDDSEDDVDSYARGGRIKKRVKRFADGGAASGDAESANGGSLGDGSLSADNPGMTSLTDTVSGATPDQDGMGAGLMAALSNAGTGISNFGSGIAGFARDPRGAYNDFMGQPQNPYSTGDATNAPGGGMQPSYLDYIKAPPAPMPVVMASGGPIDTRLLHPASGPPVPLLHPLNIEGANGNQTAQNPQDYADKIKQLRLQAAMDGRQNSMRRNDPRYAHGIAGQMGLDPKDVADRLRTDSMKKGGVVKMAEGSSVTPEGKGLYDDPPVEYPAFLEGLGAQQSRLSDKEKLQSQLDAWQDISRNKGGVPGFDYNPNALSGFSSENTDRAAQDSRATQIPRAIQSAYDSVMQPKLGPIEPPGPLNTRDSANRFQRHKATLNAPFGGQGAEIMRALNPQWTPDNTGGSSINYDQPPAPAWATETRFPIQDNPPAEPTQGPYDLDGVGSPRALTDTSKAVTASNAGKGGYGSTVGGSRVGSPVGNGGAQTQSGGASQPGQPGGRQAMSDDALTADSILKAQMDAIKDRTEDRKSAQERANNDALIAMGAAMMGAKGPNALAALGEGINAGTAARRATMATSDAIAQQNIQNRHAIASDLIKQNYYNGTISAKLAHTQQTALNAAMAAGNAAASRDARSAASRDANATTRLKSDQTAATAQEKAGALTRKNAITNAFNEWKHLSTIDQKMPNGEPHPQTQAAYDRYIKLSSGR